MSYVFRRELCIILSAYFYLRTANSYFRLMRGPVDLTYIFRKFLEETYD